MSNRTFELARTRVTLFEALLRARDARGGKYPILEDHERKVLSYDDIVRAAFALGGKLDTLIKRHETAGIMLPTGVGCVATFFALHAIGRTPALLNFTAGAMNLKAACQSANVKKVLTSRMFIKLAGLEALEAELSKHVRLIYLEDVRKTIDFGDKLVALVKGAMPRVFAAKGNPDDTGVILFTSGSYGTPKGAVLSHANIVGNVEQVHAHIDFDPNWSFFCPLPMFHCFGLTGGVMLPLFTGHKTFLFPSPLQVKEIPKLIKETGANVFFATDTFAMQYARNAKDGDLNCIELMVCGAERVKPETREIYKQRFNIELLEGYGATEASPVISVNIPGRNKHGTVGPFLPGIEWRLEHVPGIEGGQKLFVRGPNVMRGYLDPTKPFGIDLLPQGWHDTGDVVDVDQDGFIRILGRVKRFAKVAGEMVSLNAVEAYAANVWPENLHAAVALPDSRKGERVILFTDRADATSEALLAWCKANGASELAVPKRIVVIDSIPVLGSGKTDYVALQRTAAEQFAEAKAA
ncbi:AMP-binding protein [Terricaulis sp.]|jgi:acyl-[acyl-carrier-protein]-phospholipid O-acyltransferase/long-chain-fatty-acid--[acyl-carrier-protein] ligase|uniref:AMP-binding protein n=1 Tax=Terricaulis sp. TaxID=2768686 RepID=UPI000AAAE1FB|nr:AMP-binding protein [Terricaulis sp.]MDZ4693262.1 AMP-binding protein [Terricaulis sp.]